MEISPEIRLSQISAKIDSGKLTFNDLNQIAEDLSQLIQSSTGKVRDAALKVFDQSQAFKSKKVKDDVSQIDKLFSIDGKAQSLMALADEMDPESLQEKIADLAEEILNIKPFFRPELEEEAKRVKDKVDDLEISHVFEVLKELGPTGDFALYLEKRAEEIEGGSR